MRVAGVVVGLDDEVTESARLERARRLEVVELQVDSASAAYHHVAMTQRRRKREMGPLRGGTYQPAFSESLVDSIRGVFLHGFFAFRVLGDVVELASHCCCGISIAMLQGTS